MMGRAMLRIDVESEEPGRVVAMSTATLEQGRAMAKVRNPEVLWDDIPWDGIGTPIELDESLELGHVVYRRPQAGLPKIVVGEGGDDNAGAEGEWRIPLGSDGQGVPDSEAGGDAGRSDPGVAGSAHDPVASQEGQGAQEGVGRQVCTSCWFDSHHCVDNRRCACWVCRDKEQSNMLGMPQDTINRDTQEWQRIEEAVAFRMPNGDDILIVRSVACPTCGKPIALVLADGTTIGYSRRHVQCGVVTDVANESNEQEDGGQDG